VDMTLLWRETNLFTSLGINIDESMDKAWRTEE